MYKLLFFIIIFITACSENKSSVTVIPATDTLMDSTTIKMKADTTIKMLDKLDDSIKKLRDKAAENAGQ